MLDRLERLVRSWVTAAANLDERPAARSAEADAAWAELEAYLESQRPGTGSVGGGGGYSSTRRDAGPRAEHGGTAGASRRTAQGGTAGASAIPHVVRQALFDLELTDEAASSDPAAIRRAYRAQLKRFHPDNYARNRDQMETAMQITQRLTVAYHTLTDYYG